MFIHLIFQKNFNFKLLKTIIFNININTDAIYFSVLSAQQLTATLYGHNDQISGYYNITPNENYGVNIFEAFDNLYGNNVNNSNITKIIFLDNEGHIYTKFNESLTPASFLQFLRDFNFVSNTDDIKTNIPIEKISKLQPIKSEKVKDKPTKRAKKDKDKPTKQAKKDKDKLPTNNVNSESSPPFWYDDNFKNFRDFILKPEDFKDSITPNNLRNIFSSFKTAVFSNINKIEIENTKMTDDTFNEYLKKNDKNTTKNDKPKTDKKSTDKKSTDTKLIRSRKYSISLNKEQEQLVDIYSKEHDTLYNLCVDVWTKYKDMSDSWKLVRDIIFKRFYNQIHENYETIVDLIVEDLKAEYSKNEELKQNRKSIIATEQAKFDKIYEEQMIVWNDNHKHEILNKLEFDMSDKPEKVKYKFVDEDYLAIKKRKER